MTPFAISERSPCYAFAAPLPSPTMISSLPNADQRLYWNETMGPTWGRYHKVLNAQLQAFGYAAMDRASLAEGERVIDVGCGTGETSMELGRRVGAKGSILGVDLSLPLLSIAREALAQTSLHHVRFEHADASSFSYEDAADVIFSRFGVMFFDNPLGAFTHLRHKLRSGGRLSMAVWRAAEHNPWMVVPLMAVAQHVTIAPPVPNAPGPLAFADRDRVTAILEGAGFHHVAFDALDMPMAVGGATTLEETVEFLTSIGPAARALREAPREVIPAAKASMHEALAPFLTPAGVLLQGSVWLVTARAA